MRPRIQKSMPIHVRRERDGMSSPHLAMVRLLPCLVCGSAAPSHAHHLMRTGEHGMGRKSADKWATPLCQLHHDPRCSGSVHHAGDEDVWFAERGIDARAVAAALWSARGDLNAMQRVIFRARQAVFLKGGIS